MKYLLLRIRKMNQAVAGVIAVSRREFRSPLTQTMLNKDVGVWCNLLRALIDKKAFALARREMRRFVGRIPRPVFEEMVSELYVAMARERLVPSPLTRQLCLKDSWPERNKWKNTPPKVFTFLGYEESETHARPALAKWYQISRWRARNRK